MKNCCLLALLVLAAIAGCSKRDSSSLGSRQDSYSASESSKSELTRDTVLRLVQGRISEKVIARMNNGSFATAEDKTDVYTGMINDNVIRCKPNEHRGGEKTWIDCIPGENAPGLYVSSSERNALDMVIGYKVPTEVTGISRVNQNTASADIRLAFLEDEVAYRMFNKYSSAFWSNDLNRGRNNRHVILRLYDDGWRLENW